MVDSHTHLLPGKLAEKVRAFFELHMTGNKSLAYPLDHLQILNMLNGAGVGVIWNLPYAHKPGVARGLNLASTQISGNFSGHPVKIIGGATVHPLDERPVTIVLEGLNQGLKVLKLHCSVGNYEPDHPALDPVWELISKRKMPVVVHCGQAVSGHTGLKDLEPLERVIQNFPEARIIIAHSAHPVGVKALDLVEKYAGVYADLTPVIFEPVDLPPTRVKVLSSKILFGSDTPNTGLDIPACLAHLQTFGLAPEEEAAILGLNATRLLNEMV